MKGHFLPRKSKFVFLNNSIEPYRADVLRCIIDTGLLQKFPSPNPATAFQRYHKTD